MKDQLIYKIEKIVKNEKFKLDAFFLCGAPSGLPDDSLKKACEKYLEENAMQMGKKLSVTADLQSKKMQVAGEKKKETKRDCKKSETVI